MEIKFESLPDFDVMEVSHRGGAVGWHDHTIACFLEEFSFKAEDVYEALPAKLGVFCNYLGGGVRGAIFRSQIDRAPKKMKPYLEALIDAAQELYMECEHDLGLNEEDDYLLEKYA